MGSHSVPPVASARLWTSANVKDQNLNPRKLLVTSFTI